MGKLYRIAPLVWKRESIERSHIDRLEAYSATGCMGIAISLERWHAYKGPRWNLQFSGLPAGTYPRLPAVAMTAHQAKAKAEAIYVKLVEMGLEAEAGPQKSRGRR